MRKSRGVIVPLDFSLNSTKIPMKHFLTLLIISTPLLLKGQNAGMQNRYTNDDVETWLKTNALRDFNENDGAVGSRFMFDAWRLGNINLKNGGSITDVKLRYDELNDDLLVYKPGISKGVILEKSNIEGFEMMGENGQKHKFILASFDDGISFFQVLLDGRSKVLRKREKILKKPSDNSQAYSSGAQYAKYVSDYSVFLWLKDSKPVKLPGNKKTLLELFDPYAPAMETFIKKNKLKFKNELDLAKIVQHYDSLQ